MERLRKTIFTNKVSWKAVIISAVVCGILTGCVLNLESLLINTSLFNIGTCFEFWILAAMVIILRSEKPLDAALKTFLFFLISQPLVFLVKVPFSELGWGAFKDYPGWFVWTVLTFPGAMIMWYVKKKNWLSVFLYMLPMLFLSVEFALHFSCFVRNIPYQFLALVFILSQIVLYVLNIKDKKKRIALSVMTSLALIALTILLFNN